MSNPDSGEQGNASAATGILEPGRVSAALHLAAELHGHQVRKGTNIPYLSHLLAVAALVAEDGGTTDEVAAALLHDAAEDQGGHHTLARISRLLGPQVAHLVEECSDSLLERSAVKPPWRERKERALLQLTTVSHGALLIGAADKLHNLQATQWDVRAHGPEVWQRFRAGRDGLLWYYREASRVLSTRLPESRSVQRLGQTLQELAENY